MTKPTPEQFSLTSETIASLRVEQAARERQRNEMDWTIIKGLWLVGAVLYLTYNLAIGRPTVELLLYAFVTMCIGFMLTLASSLVLPHLSYLFFPDLPSYMQLKRFQEAMARYEMWFIRTKEEFWERLSGREFEIEVTNLLNRAGYRAHLTPASGDGGVDIVLGDGTIVQCKAHRTPASPGVVRELYGALTHQNAPKAILISLSGVTEGVRYFIKDKPITVWDKSDLVALQKALDKS